MNSTLRLNRFDRNAIFVLILVMIVFAAPLVIQQISASADYSWRIRQVVQMTERDIYSYLILAVLTILPFIGLILATVIVSTIFYIATAIVLYRILAAELSSRPRLTTIALGIITLAIIVIQPISVTPLLSTRDMLFEWIILSPHYNPTTLALRPLVLPLTLIAVTTFTNLTTFTWKQVAGIMVLLIFSTLIKPNWLMAFLPVYSLIIVIAWLRGIAFDRRMVLLGFGMSSLIALAITFGLGTPASNSTIAIRFFAYEVTPIVVLKLLLSVAFPLYISILWREQAKQDWVLLLSWGVLAAAIAQGLLFDETGLRAGHGNFLWGQSIAGWIVFVLSVRLYVRQTATLQQTTLPTMWTWRIATLLLILHTVTGLLWWIAHYGIKPVLYA